MREPTSSDERLSGPSGQPQAADIRQNLWATVISSRHGGVLGLKDGPKPVQQPAPVQSGPVMVR